MVDRRRFLGRSASGIAAAALGASWQASAAAPAHRFPLKFAPHFGMFRHRGGKDLIDQLKFAADQGFEAWEDNGMKRRPVEVQERIAKALSRLKMTMGVFVATGTFRHVTFAGEDQAAREQVLRDIRDSVEVAKRVGAKWMTVVPGRYDPKLPWEYQTANCIELLRRCCDILEPHGLVMVLEPLNRHVNHPGVFLHRSPQAFLICRAVRHPCCKILFDIYHQQITEGNLIPNITRCWDEIGYFQVGDHPGRKEPGTGEIHYANIFRLLHQKGYAGVVGMEHGNAQPGPEGEDAVIDAYVRASRF